MTTITKDEAQAVADLKAGYTVGHADVEILQRLASIALAALNDETKAEPDAYLVSGGKLYRDKSFLSLAAAEESVRSRNDGAEIKRLYVRPPERKASQHNKAPNGIMPDYDGVAMSQRECYRAGYEAGKAEQQKAQQNIPGGLT